jgi:replication-associated recombination protein RarA
MAYEIRTKRGYALLDVASALQKSIRRGDEKIAGYMALELFASNFHNYAWKRLLTISAEDVHKGITHEIKALHDSFVFMNKKESGKKAPKSRIFLSKAVLILCRAVKSRDADHLQILTYDKAFNITEEEILQELAKRDKDEFLEIPEYTYDCHTKKGKLAGKTKAEFMIDEQKALMPRPEQTSMWDDIIDQNS